MKKHNRIVLVSSSTGGHALPIYNVRKALTAKGFRVSVFHSGSKIEKEIFGNHPGIKIIAGKIKRYNYMASIWEVFKSVIGFVESFFILLFQRPKIIFSKGGFCSVPVLLAAQVLGIPYVVHESDSVMGVSNRMFAKKAKKVFVGFPIDYYSTVDRKKLQYVGQIVSVDDSKEVTKGDLPVVFITGGSQGAKSLNEVALSIIDQLLLKYKVIHQTGEKEYDRVISFWSNLPEELKNNYEVYSFSIGKSRESLISADLIVGRAGANTIGEIAALSKASILIPYKYAAHDHQTINAKYLEKGGAAIVIREENLDGKSLIERINYILLDERNAKTLGEKANKLIKSDGLKEVVNYLLTEGK